MRVATFALMLSFIAIAGCEPAPTSAPATPATAPAPPPPAPAAAAPPAPAPAETVTRVAADQMLGVAGENQKGADYTWTYTRTLFTNYFGVQETVVLGQVKQALAMYEADKGHKPKTSDEGLEAISSHNITLPELPDETFSYEFDPEKQELVVVHKEPAPGK